MISDPHLQRVLDHVRSATYQAQTLDGLARALGVPAAELGTLATAVTTLIHRGRLLRDPDGSLLAVRGGQVVGTYRGNRRGFGFCLPFDRALDDLFVPPGHHGGALSGDEVLVRSIKKGKRGGRMLFEGHVLKVLKRARRQFVGEVHALGDRWAVRIDGSGMPFPVFVPDAPSAGAKAGSQVVVEIIRFPNDDNDAQGVITEVLGERHAPGVDLLGVIRQFELPDAFSDACIAEARQAVVQFEGMSFDDRLDLRDTVILTIDPDDARDFDDAISVVRRPDGWTLGVHIADVSAFVPEGGALDLTARERGNSVYFPGHVIPMLPEVLSNGVCSLQQGIDRLTLSAFIELDTDGSYRSSTFARSVIRSHRRLTYREAAAVLDGRTGGVSGAIVQLLEDMNTLARQIRKRRIDAGMLVLQLPDAELVLDDGGLLLRVEPEDTSFTHTIIEMFMVEANEAAARLLTEHGVVHLRRVHDEPEPAALTKLRDFLTIIGLSPPDTLDRHAIQALLAEVGDTSEAYVANFAVLRAQQAACYAPQFSGHYALASKQYSHFTSPIRRYPDLIVHRLIGAVLEHGRDVVVTQNLAEIGEACTETERRAESAERELKFIKVLEYLKHRDGETFDGAISAVTDFGLFVRLDDYLIEGLLAIDDLPPPPWDVVREMYCAVNSASGHRITVGDRVRVRLARIDVAARQLDLVLERQLTRRKAVALPRPPRRQKKAPHKGRTAGRSASRNRTPRRGKRR